MNLRATIDANHRIHVRALLVGDRIELKKFQAKKRIAANPLVLAVSEHGLAVLFRYGAIVLFDLSAEEEASFLGTLTALITQPLPTPESEELEVEIKPSAEEGVFQELIVVNSWSVERIQVIAEVLARSVLLAAHEVNVTATFEQIEPMALAMEQNGRPTHHAREFVRHIGTTLLSLHRMVGRAELGDKPELLWEHPELELLYARLENEFEIRDRQIALERKLDLIFRTGETLLELNQARRSLRVEWYIVILIVVEILLMLYELFLPGH